MNALEVYFNARGNTVIGNYSTYLKLDGAMQAKGVFSPVGYVIKVATNSDFSRLLEHVRLFGNCIKTLAGFDNACKLAGVEFVKDTHG